MRRSVVAAAILAATVVLAAGCGGSSHPQTTTRAAAGSPKCTLSPKQRRVVRRANQMIVDMHHLDERLKTVHEHGPKKLELELNRFLLSIGTLPLNERALLIRKAKSAVGLCRDCFDALESLEPAVQASPCKAGL